MEEVLGSWFAAPFSHSTPQTIPLMNSYQGQDLQGNTFWEFRDALNANRLRRIVKYNSKAHLGDVNISRMDIRLAFLGLTEILATYN